MLTIQFDHQIFCEQKFGGISRYFYELIKGISSGDSVGYHLDVKYSDNTYLQQLHPDNAWLTHASFKGKKDLVRMINRVNTFYHTRFNQFDIFHPTYFHSSCIKNKQGKPMVLTVYDLVDEKYNSNDPVFKTLIAHRAKSIHAADCIIAISANTKNDLIEHFNISPEKIIVIYLGNSLEQKDIDAQPIKKSSAAPYLLYIGSRKGQHKNLKLFVQAMKQVLIAEKDLSLVFGGGGAFSKDEELLFAETGIRDRVSFSPIQNDQSLIALYKNAALFVYPSIYEGFGLPVLEAFSCGVPCIISKGSSIQEVGENAAAYFTPTDTDSISSAVLETYRNEQKQKELIIAGYEQSKKFSWDIMLEETLQTYNSLI